MPARVARNEERAAEDAHRVAGMRRRARAAADGPRQPGEGIGGPERQAEAAGAGPPQSRSLARLWSQS